MMVRIRTIAAALALCAASITPAAMAQTVAEHDNRAPEAPVARAAEEPDALATPPLPEMPEALRPRVTAMARIVSETSECFTDRGERSEHIADRRCPSWFAALQRGGPAAAHAIGLALVRPPGPSTSDEDGDNYNYEMSEEPARRLVQVLVATRAPEATPYLLRRLVDVVQRNGSFSIIEEEVLRQFVRISGDDPMPIAPWERDALRSANARHRVTLAWSRWFRDHASDTPEQRAAAAETRALADLNAEDPAVRFASVQRLATHPVHGPAAAAALRDLLARRDLPARAAVFIRRWAQRTHVPLTAPETVASRS
jgi:hypothetical protein